MNLSRHKLLPLAVKRALLLLAIAAGLAWEAASCADSAPSGQCDRFVIALLDETASFGYCQDPPEAKLPSQCNPDRWVELWGESRRLAEWIVRELEPGAAFAVLGINDLGFNSQDVRVNKVVFVERGRINKVIERHRIVLQVRQIKPRRKAQTTNIIGSLELAQDLLKVEPGRCGLLLLFSDMVQTPSMPRPSDDSLKHLRLRPDTEVHCFFVNVSGRAAYESLVNTWIKIFAAVGVTMTEDNFHPRHRTEDELRQVIRLRPGANGRSH